MNSTELNIINDYQNNKRVVDLSAKYDKSEATIYRILERNGIQRRHITTSVNEEIINSLKKGESAYNIAESNNCSLGHVYKIRKKLVKNQLTTMPTSRKTSKKARAVQSDYANNTSVKELCIKYNLSESSVYRILKQDINDIVTYYVVKPEFNNGEWLNTPQPLGYFISQDIDLAFLNPVVYDFKPLSRSVIEIDEVVDMLKNHSNNKKIFRLGIAGPKYIGKSYLARAINDQVENSVVHSFAEPIKQKINYYERLNTCSKEQLRKELIEIGERKKLRDPLYWVNKAFETPIPEGVNVIIYDDVRFIPEALEMDMLLIIDGPYSNDPSERGFLQKEVNHFKKHGVRVKRYRGDV